MLIDKGLNDQWVKPKVLRPTGTGRYRLTLKEPLQQRWADEIVRSCSRGE